MMQPSRSGIRFYQGNEGCILHPYHGDKDPPGVMTIYYGHVIRPGDVFRNTQEDADAYLLRDSRWAMQWLWRNCPWSVGEPNGRQHNFDALWDLVLNAGHVFDDLLAEVNGPNDPARVKAFFLMHARAGKDPNALKFRRAKEAAFYLTPDPPTFSDDEVREVLNQVALSARQVLVDDGFAAA